MNHNRNRCTSKTRGVKANKCGVSISAKRLAVKSLL